MVSFDYELTKGKPEILQVNVGAKCNLSCKHCHWEGGPDKLTFMCRKTMDKVLAAAERLPSITTIDITGGSPEYYPFIRELLEGAAALGKQLLFRTNLVALQERPELIPLLKRYQVELVGSLPCYTEENVDRQRGEGVFKKSLAVLQQLNREGYGLDATYRLNLVYNPGGDFLPGDQHSLEKDYRERLAQDYGISFNCLYTITNVPIGRFARELEEEGNKEKYLTMLADNFNRANLDKVMCLTMISVGADGLLYDCDFNQALEWPASEGNLDIGTVVEADIVGSKIVTGTHCFACVAGCGSSCQGRL